MYSEKSQSDLFSDDFHLDETGKMHIRSLASWAMIVVVCSVIGYIISIYQMVAGKGEEIASTEGFTESFYMSVNTAGGSIVSIIVGLIINFFLYRFASQSKLALGSLDPEQLNNSFRSLKIYFVITSIIMILLLLLVLLAMTAMIR